MSTIDIKAAFADDWAFACETCMRAGCPPLGGCASMWCPCPCNTDDSSPPMVTADARFGPGCCYFCGSPLDDPADDIGVDEDHPDGAIVDDRTCRTCRRDRQQIRLIGDLR